MTHGRRAAGLVLVTALAASLSACGGADDATTSGPTSSDSSSAAAPSPSESATPSASPTSSTPPLSRFEDDPAVVAARAWAAAVAVDVNNKDATYAATAPLTVKATRAKLSAYLGDELKAGVSYPGPLPFTPVRLRTTDATTTVVTCTWASGWGIDPATNKPKEKKDIRGEDFVMKKTATGYLLQGLSEHPGLDCSDVNVKGVAG